MTTRMMILALSLGLTGVPALAAPATDQPSAEVRIGDLDLTTAQGQQRLETRVKSAARSLCGTGTRGLADIERRSRCIAAALSNARPQAERAIARAQDGTRLALLMVHAAR